jgi:chitin disaccharide deacetylase
MTIRLIVNADDYARTPQVSKGIREAHLKGIVTSTTVMMNMLAVVQDLELALAECPELGLGVHLVLTSGRPVLPVEQVPSLVGPDGRFHKLDRFTSQLHQINLDEVRAEWRAQADKFTAVSGRKPTHFDSHHHSSYFSRDLFRSMLELAQERQCGIRPAAVQLNSDTPLGLPDDVTSEASRFVPDLLQKFNPSTADDFYATFYDETATLEDLLSVIHSLPEGTHEIMCHPGYVDEVLLAGSTYANQRVSELEVLTDPRLREALEARQIELVSYADLQP